jgi:hypothetical protein
VVDVAVAGCLVDGTGFLVDGAGCLVNVAVDVTGFLVDVAIPTDPFTFPETEFAGVVL